MVPNSIIFRMQTTEAYSFDWGILSIPQISVAYTSMQQISAAYTIMTQVSSFENGRNAKIISALTFVIIVSK